jgi:PDZ domain-containing secreted protein
MKEKPKIPTELEFSRAKQKMRKRLSEAADLKAAILARLPKSVPCHDVWVWLSNEFCTVSFIFPNDADLDSREDESQTLIEAAIKNASELKGLEELKIEYHSHEHVLKKFNGNYDQYFR